MRHIPANSCASLTELVHIDIVHTLILWHTWSKLLLLISESQSLAHLLFSLLSTLTRYSFVKNRYISSLWHIFLVFHHRFCLGLQMYIRTSESYFFIVCGKTFFMSLSSDFWNVALCFRSNYDVQSAKQIFGHFDKT